MAGLTLPTYEPQVEVQARPIAPQASPEPGAAPYQGAEHLNYVEYFAARKMAEQAAQSNALAVGKTLSQARLDQTKALFAAQQSAPAGAPGFTDQYLKQFDDYSQTAVKNAPEDQQPLLQDHLGQLRTELADRAMMFEAHADLAKRQSDLSDAVTTQANAVRTDPTQFDSARQAALASVGSAGLPADQAQTATRHVNDMMAMAAVEGWQDRDPAKAKTLLNSGQLDNFLAPNTKNVLLDRANALAERQQKQAQAALQSTVKDQYADEVSAIRDRGYGLGILTPARLKAAFPDQATNLIQNLDTERQFYNARQQIALSSPEQDKDILAQYQPEGANYAAQAQRRDLLEKAINQKWNAVQKDPAAYVLQASPALQQAWQDASADPAKLPAALSLSSSLQSQLGVPQDMQRVMPANYAASQAADIATLPPDQAAAKISTMATQYGPQWNKAFSELTQAHLPAAYQVLATVDGPARTALVEALKAGPKQLADLAGPSADAIKKGMPQIVGPFLRTVTAAPNGAPIADAWQNATQALAYRYAGQGMDPDDAINRAYDDLIGSRYDIANAPGYNARAPKGTLPQVEAYADNLLANLKPADIMAPPRGSGEIPYPTSPRALADAQLHLTPQEQFLYQHHLDNLNGSGKVVQPSGDISTILQETVDMDGRTYNIPTVWNGKILDDKAAFAKARSVGLDEFPSYASEAEAETRYQQMHVFMNEDVENYLAKQRGAINLTDAQRQQAYFRDGVQHGAQWRSIDDNTWGLVDSSGRYMVQRADGTPLTFSVKDAVTTASATPALPTVQQSINAGESGGG